MTIQLTHIDHLGLRVNFKKSNLVPLWSSTDTDVALDSGVYNPAILCDFVSIVSSSAKALPGGQSG